MKPNPASLLRAAFPIALALACSHLQAAAQDGGDWKSIPLIADGKVAPEWLHIGYGHFAVEDGALKTVPAPEGLGLLVYKKERLGNCQIKVVFKTKDAKSNSGIYVRIADGILDQVKQPGAAFDRDAAGKPSDASSERVKASAGREEGPWYAVHNGYEIQIVDAGGELHGTGSLYSLAPASGAPKGDGNWRTMIVTLDGPKIGIELEGKKITSFDSSTGKFPPPTQWYQPKREPKRPEAGYIGLQTHDPGDTVWFKEVSVRPLPQPTAPGDK